MSAKWSLMGGDSALKGLTIKSTIGTGKVTFTFVNETAETITLAAGDSATTGKMVVDIGGISFTVDLTVTAAT